MSETTGEVVSQGGATASPAGQVADAMGQAGQTAGEAGAAATDTAGQTGGAAGASVAGAGPAATGGAGAAAAGAAAAGGGAAGTAGASAPKGEPTFTAIYREILTVGSAGNCMFAGCHGAPPDPMLNGNLTIMFGDQAGAYKNLVDVTSTSTACTGKKLVVPGDAAGSLLIQKFSDAPPCGAKMPIGRPLTEAQIKQIETWINDGAMDN
jgi:hypothetical protein